MESTTSLHFFSSYNLLEDTDLNNEMFKPEINLCASPQRSIPISKQTNEKCQSEYDISGVI